MTPDERAIRDVITRWANATAAGDTAAVLALMSDDVLFMTPGREPFGKDAFAAQSAKLRDTKIESTSHPVEIQVSGDWAYARTQLTVKMTQPGGAVNARSGYTLSIFKRGPDGSWLLIRDANLLV